LAALIPGPLLRVATATTLVVAAFSMLNPVLAVRLQASGHSATAIGVFVMLPFLAVALMVPLMPRLFAVLGIARAYRAGLLLEALATLGYAVAQDYLLWCAMAVAGGIGAAALWNGTEALIAHNAPPALRGRFMGLYQTGMGLAITVGPFVPGVLPLSPDGLTLLAAATLLVALAVTMAPGVGALQASREGARHVGLIAAVRRVPGLAWVALAGGVFEAGLGSISTAYGAERGLSLAAATTIAGVLGFGSTVLQYPCGWLADHLSPRRLFTIAGVVLGVSSAAFALAVHWLPAVWIAAFGWGAVGGALYTLTMIRVSHDFADSSPVSGTAAMITGYTLGGAIGPSVSGAVLDTAGAAGQAAWLVLLSASVVLVARRLSGSPAASASA
jgi:MFS family permease